MMVTNQYRAPVRRVTKRTARRLHSTGVAIYVLPCNMYIGNPWVQPMQLQPGEAFDSQINACEYYNCNSKTGRYLAYYTPA